MPSFGLMTNGIRNLSRFTLFAKEAERIGFERTLLFTPNEVDFHSRTIWALCYSKGTWSKQRCPYPSVAHDVGFYTDAQTIRLVKRYKANVLFTGYGLGNKWQIHNQLMKSSFSNYVPETDLYRSPSTAMNFLKNYGAIMLKPINGKQGRGIVKLSFHENRAIKPYEWQQSGQPKLYLSRRELLHKLHRGCQPYGAVVQRWMDIRNPQGQVFDIRALVQKEPGGRWILTEMGVRLSQVGHIASNVTRGGSVRSVRTFLPELYGEAAAERMIEECRNMAVTLPAELENLYQKSFAELGIDLAVERGGTVRIIEVNIKPGKKIVRALSGKNAYADAMLRPVRYAKWLSDCALQTKGS